VLIPGYVPEGYITANEQKFAAAGINNPKKFSRRIGLVVDISLILILILIFISTTTSILAFLPSLPFLQWEVLLLPIALLAGLLKTSIISAVLAMKISSRREKVNAYLHQAVVSMLSYAKAGLTLPEIVKEIAVMGLDELSEIFAKIHYATVYGKTIRAAVLDAAASSPSKELAELLRGMISVVEAGGDLARFFEDRLEAYEVERKMWFTGYISKLRLVSEAYITLVVAGPIFVIVFESCRLIMGKGSIHALKTIVYVLIPAGIAILILLLHASSPEKFVRRKGMGLTLLPLLGGVFGLIAYAYEGWHGQGHVLRGWCGWCELCRYECGCGSGWNVNPELFGIAGAILGSLVATLFLYRLTSEEDRITKALPVFLNKVVALMEAEKDFTTAFRIAARDEPNPLGKYVRTFAEMVNLGVPRHKAFLWLQNATAVPDLKMIARVLGSIVNVSGKVRETMLALLGEMNRITAFRKERVSVTRMHVLVMVMAFLVYLGISAVISTKIFAQISKLSATSLSASSLTLPPPNTILGQIKAVMRHAGYIIAAATAAGIGAAKGDMRRSMPYLTALLSIAFAVGIVFLS